MFLLGTVKIQYSSFLSWNHIFSNITQKHNFFSLLLSLLLLLFQAGISKLTEARESVSNMQKKAAKKSKLLAEKQTDADMALKAISQSMTVCLEFTACNDIDLTRHS